LNLHRSSLLQECNAGFSMSPNANDALLAEVLQRNERQFAETLSTNIAPPDGMCVVSKALSASVRNVFLKMCGLDLELVDSPLSGCAISHFDASGIITISGPIQASVVLSLHENLVFAAAEAFLGKRPVRFDSDSVDLVGELTNMVAGNAKERLSMDGLVLGLPSVVTGRGHHVSFARDMQVSALAYTCPTGQLTIEVGVAPHKN
jgi:chemotaxis protein CheX